MITFHQASSLKGSTTSHQNHTGDQASGTRTFCRTHSNHIQAIEKMYNVTGYQENENQDHNNIVIFAGKILKDQIIPNIA